MGVCNLFYAKHWAKQLLLSCTFLHMTGNVLQDQKHLEGLYCIAIVHRCAESDIAVAHIAGMAAGDASAECLE